MSWEITQADRAGWQQDAVGELAAILAAHPDVPVITWTVSLTGGLSGHVLASHGRRRGLFGQWRQALGLEEVTPDPDGALTCLRARAMRNGVAVSITATVFPGSEVTA